jgi:hypothetical protein
MSIGSPPRRRWEVAAVGAASIGKRSEKGDVDLLATEILKLRMIVAQIG